jgi:UDP-N-acetylmuramyl pentapeptide phosphotransferase/UDP-N-acetylglucosamine-1-phosphate transferase
MSVIRLLLAAVVGFLGTRMAWLLLREVFRAPVLRRENYRNRPIATAGGLCVVVSLILVEGLRVLLHTLGWGPPLSASRLLTLVVVLGFGWLGFVDDLASVGNDRGFRGHSRALAQGSLTTGGLKLVGGAFVALLASSLVHELVRTGSVSRFQVIADALLLALGANLGNLLDRAPARTTKISTLCFCVLIGVLMLVGAPGASLHDIIGVAVVIGAALGLLHEENRERVMLGDTGANAVGVAVSLAVVLSTSPSVRLGVLVALVALNGLSEVVSFSRVISAVAPLRWFDQLGRTPGE